MATVDSLKGDGIISNVAWDETGEYLVSNASSVDESEIFEDFENRNY